METMSRFTSFVGKTVQSGSKSTGSAFPTIIATSTKDKYVLNQKAMALMGVGVGSYVVLIDMNRGEVTTEDPNERFFITKGWEKAPGNFEGAKLGAGGTFSYAGIYSAMQMNKPDITEATVADMVKANLGITREGKESGKENFIATQKVNYKLARLTGADADGNPVDVFEVAAGVVQQVYSLVERTVVDHEPVELSEEEEANEANDEVANVQGTAIPQED